MVTFTNPLHTKNNKYGVILRLFNRQQNKQYKYIIHPWVFANLSQINTNFNCSSHTKVHNNSTSPQQQHNKPRSSKHPIKRQIFQISAKHLHNLNNFNNIDFSYRVRDNATTTYISLRLRGLRS